MRAFVGLAILGIPVFASAVRAASRIEVDRRKRIARGVLVATLLIFSGALVAATDAKNDELWNPAFRGSWFIAAALPAAVAAALSPNDRHRTSIIVVAFIAAFPYALVAASFGGMVLTWLWRNTGIPVTW
jgi:hypothetical protein